MAQAPLKSAPVIPLDSRRRERAPAWPDRALPEPRPAPRGGGRLLGFLALSALVHGAALLLLPWPRTGAPVPPQPLVVSMAAPAPVGEPAAPPAAAPQPPPPQGARSARRPKEAVPAVGKRSPAVRPSRTPAVAEPSPAVSESSRKPMVPEPPRTPAASDPSSTPAASEPPLREAKPPMEQVVPASPPGGLAPPQVAIRIQGESGASAPAAVRSGSPAATATPVNPPSYSATYLNNPKPAYPLSARRMGQEGTVVLRVLVNAGGRPDEVRLARGAGFPVLDEAALQAVRRWTFVPARRGDVPTAGWVEVPVRFQLEHN